MNRLQIRLGFVLIFLALASAFGMPLFANQRLGLAAHTVGILGGLVLIATGALASAFRLGARASRVMMWGWAYAAYANWFASLLGAVTGASRLTPIAGRGTTGSAIAESVVAFLLESLAVVALIATALAVWGLRKPQAAPVQAAVAAPTMPPA